MGLLLTIRDDWARKLFNQLLRVVAPERESAAVMKRAMAEAINMDPKNKRFIAAQVKKSAFNKSLDEGLADDLQNVIYEFFLPGVRNGVERKVADFVKARVLSTWARMTEVSPNMNDIITIDDENGGKEQHQTWYLYHTIEE
jgi:hypothetical protein